MRAAGSLSDISARRKFEPFDARRRARRSNRSASRLAETTNRSRRLRGEQADKRTGRSRSRAGQRAARDAFLGSYGVVELTSAWFAQEYSSLWTISVRFFRIPSRSRP